MFFTQDDYKKIQQWLIKNSVKDTEFNEATIPFNGNEIVSIVQGNQNKKVFLKDLVSQIFNLGVSDFVNITDKYDAPNISLEEAIRLIPSRARKEGQVITFLDREDHWHIYQFKGVLNQWNVLDTWEDLFDWEKLIIDSILPDEEDLTKSLPDKNGNSYLSLKDREYNPEDFSGLGRVILRKNIIEVEDPIYGKVKKNILYQDMINKENTIYEIRYDFDLNGSEITIPEGCVLDFQGGSFSNGTIVGNNTKINAIKESLLFNNIEISGTWEVLDIYSNWFNFNNTPGYDNIDNFNNLSALCSHNFSNNIYINGNYWASIKSNGGYIIYVKSNTNIRINGSINLNPCEFSLYHILSIQSTQNITISGGSIVGDVKTHTGIDGEWGFGIAIVNGRNIIIKDIAISKCWGDNIYIGQTNTDNSNYSEGILIDNVACDAGRRQGMSVISAKNLKILNSRFTNTGSIKYTAPGAGIDFEPNVENTILQDIIIDNCVFDGNKYSINGDILFVNCSADSTSIKIANSKFNNRVTFYNIVHNIEFDNCYIKHVTTHDGVYSNVFIKNCNIGASSYVLLKDVTNTIVFENCSYLLSSPIYTRDYWVRTTDATPIACIKLQSVMSTYKVRLSGRFGLTNINYITEFNLSIDPNSKVCAKSPLYTTGASINQSTYLDDYKQKGILVSNAILDNEGYWNIYLKTNKGTRFEFNIHTECVLSDPYPLLTYPKIDIPSVSASSLPSSINWKNTFLGNTWGTTETINDLCLPDKGCVIYNNTLAKPIFGDGTKWVDATGAAV